MSMHVVHPGALSLLQDSGRTGQHRLGLTNGGPMDAAAYSYCNRLLSNPTDATVIEISIGGLVVEAQVDTFICLTGAPMTLTINDEERPPWRVLPVSAGDRIAVGFASRGCRTYLGVADGFDIAPQFGSTATVPRESIGGLNGGPLQQGDSLPCAPVHTRQQLYLPEAHRPRYQNSLTVRVIPGYQQRWFNRIEQRRFFGGAYTVSERCDRMGYRLEGSPVTCAARTLFSEGICHGAIQIPPDGQPIVLLNDRQTIGGYPKIGSALSLDTWRLAQLTAGATVHFAPISVHTAHRALELARRFTLAHALKEC